MIRTLRRAAPLLLGYLVLSHLHMVTSAQQAALGAAGPAPAAGDGAVSSAELAEALSRAFGVAEANMSEQRAAGGWRARSWDGVTPCQPPQERTPFAKPMQGTLECSISCTLLDL